MGDGGGNKGNKALQMWRAWNCVTAKQNNKKKKKNTDKDSVPTDFFNMVNIIMSGCKSNSHINRLLKFIYKDRAVVESKTPRR